MNSYSSRGCYRRGSLEGILEEKYRLCRRRVTLAVVGALWSRSKHAWDDGYGVKSRIERSVVDALTQAAFTDESETVFV